MTWLSDDAVERLRDVAAWPDCRRTATSPAPDRPRRHGRGLCRARHGARSRGRDQSLERAPAPTRPRRAAAARSARAGALEHPGIVPVHDAGVLDDGRVFYVMKLVRGQTLTEHAGDLRAKPRRLGVFERIAEPSRSRTPPASSIAISSRRTSWSAASARSSCSTGASPLIGRATRRPAARVGTPGFMAPEQQRGDSARRRPPADVFALGALLSWLLTGDCRARSTPPAGG